MTVKLLLEPGETPDTPSRWCTDDERAIPVRDDEVQAERRVGYVLGRNAERADVVAMLRRWAAESPPVIASTLGNAADTIAGGYHREGGAAMNDEPANLCHYVNWDDGPPPLSDAARRLLARFTSDGFLRDEETLPHDEQLVWHELYDAGLVMRAPLGCTLLTSRGWKEVQR
jgi:hypothetical protein